MDEWEIFFYDEKNECVSSLTKYHAENCSIEPLVEAHPETIYFFAKLQMHKDWDFNEYPGTAFYAGSYDEPLFVLPETITPVPIGRVLEVRETEQGIEFDTEYFCVGIRGCQANGHTNDCPEWEE